MVEYWCVEARRPMLDLPSALKKLKKVVDFWQVIGYSSCIKGRERKRKETKENNFGT